MRWQGRRGSRNIEDRRRMGGGAVGGIGGVGLIAVLVIGYFLGIDVTPLLEEAAAPQQGGGQVTEADERAAEFVSVTLADTEEVWTEVFRDQLGATYRPPVLVLFKGATQSPCGGASAATGPFYCPLDRKVYLDTGFFTTLSQRLGAKGDFAAAYVVAHEVGHHVENELGILERTMQARQSDNSVSVKVELMADCLSGVWARHAAEQLGTLEPGDVEEAMNAAAQIGDDRLSGGRIRPDAFTHGSSEQRQQWFATGYDTPQIAACNTGLF